MNLIYRKEIQGVWVMIRECMRIVFLLGATAGLAGRLAHAEPGQGGLCDVVEELARYAATEQRAPGGAATDQELMTATMALIQLDAAYWELSAEERGLLHRVAAHVYQAVYSGEQGDPDSMRAGCHSRLKEFEVELHKAHPVCQQQATILHDYAQGREAGRSESEARAWLALTGSGNVTLRGSAIDYVYRHAGTATADEVAQQGYVACLKERIGD